MKHLFLIIMVFSFRVCLAQDEQVTIKTPQKEAAPPAKIFYSQKVINTKSAEVVHKGILEFNVAHNFGDIGGDFGGIKRFFGLDNTTDVRIGFQLGLGDRINLVAARAKGLGVTQQWELGLKWQILRQLENDASHPLTLTMYVNDVVSTQKRSALTNQETSFEDFGDRHSQVVQLLLAKKVGKVSFQFNPLYLHTNLVVPYDQENIFALGGALRIPISKKIIFLADYFHPFRSQDTRDAFELNGLKLYDPLGVGFEIVTEGHTFHLNFTNTTDILENRFIRRTTTNWGDGEFRWAFTITRNFVLFKDKKNNN